MCTDETTTYESPDDTSQGTFESPDGSEQGTYEAPGDGTPGWSRRTFLKAAALGTAAAALVSVGGKGDLNFGPLSALADDLSASQCVANDVRIIGDINIINEPCDLPLGSPFLAQATVRVVNNAANSNWCVTAHLPPKTIGGTTFGGDILIAREIKGKSDGVYTITIPNYPAGGGRQCFGADIPDTYTKGPCPGQSLTPKQSCATISYFVNDPGTCPAPAGTKVTSKCRHQQICIQGRGKASLDCSLSDGVQTNCPVDCGGNATVRLCTTGGPAPYTFRLSVPGQADQVIAGSFNLCENFTVSLGEGQDPVTITGKVTDSGSPQQCTSSATATLVPQKPPAPVIELTGGPNCDRQVTVSVKNPVAGTAYRFYEGGVELVGTGSSRTKTYASPATSPESHTITATATTGGCTSDPSNEVSFDIYAALGLTLTSDHDASAACDSGQVVFTATASGGKGPYSFEWTGGGTVGGSGATSTLTYKPSLTGGTLDTSCHTISCTVTDSQTPLPVGTPGCTATKAARISQCVTSTVESGPCS